MIRYYTAIGTIILEKREGWNHPLVLHGSQEAELSISEMILWSLLASMIRTYEDAKQDFEKRQMQLQLPVLSFESTLQRLVFRGLVAQGEGEKEDDALFQLLQPLKVMSSKITLFSCCKEFLRYTLINRMPIHIAAPIFKKLQSTVHEKYILHLLKGQKMSIEELIILAKPKYGQPVVIAGIANLYCNGLIYLI